MTAAGLMWQEGANEAKTETDCLISGLFNPRNHQSGFRFLAEFAQLAKPQLRAA